MQSMKALFIRDSCARYQWSMSSKTKKKKNDQRFRLASFSSILFYYTFRWDGACSGTSSHTNTTTWLFALAQLSCCCWGRGASPSLGHSLWLCDVYRKEERWHGLSAFPNSIRQLTKMEIQLDISNRQCDVCAQQVSSISVYGNTFFFFCCWLRTPSSLFLRMLTRRATQHLPRKKIRRAQTIYRRKKSVSYYTVVQ